MANIIINGNRVNNVNVVELENADDSQNPARFAETMVGGEGITVVGDTISINTVGATAGDQLIFDGTHLGWGKTATALTSAEVTAIVNSIQ